MENISSRYQPKEAEEKWYKHWEKQGYFTPKIDIKKKPYVIVIPPPNVTGVLHMGHALNNVLQDVLIRWKRMQGIPTLWLPGTDHAGIATQNVVEKMLSKKGIKRQDLGREKFIKEVWRWKEEHGSTIINQLKKLGCSCDWSRERFTMDEGLSDAVEEVFIRLYQEGLIYRGNYIVNWCPRCQTALSDEEAPHKEVQGNLYYIKYPIKSVIGSRLSVLGRTPNTEHRTPNFVVVATTRPETMLGDTAVAVHPKDKRYKNLIGRKLILPILNREIPVISDTVVESDFGSGAVKITPSHDPNDFEIARRQSIEGILVMNPDGTMNENAGQYKGKDRFECRKAILKDLKMQGLLLKTEAHQHSVGHCYRCHTMIEPYLSRQWFVRMKPLAKKAIEVVKKGEIKFYPQRWTKVYLNWMENIRDWCISRQIWWGHRLPVFYCRKCQGGGNSVIGYRLSPNTEHRTPNTDKGIIVAKTKPEKCPICGSSEIYQDEDVLDTWFSSWLWPFSTLGWPEKKSKIKNQKSKIKSDLNYFYPTSTLVTAPEIIFFWVARMIMAGMKFMGKIPFKDVYIHGTVRDDLGKKMSKSLGNAIDPLEVIKEVGTDALRFSIVFISATGQDVFLSKQKFAVGRNFANKLWNASRYILALPECKWGSVTNEDLGLKERWILSRLNQTVKEVNRSLENYRFQEAESKIYEFFWHQFCDWYIELAKPVQNSQQSTVPAEGGSAFGGKNQKLKNREKNASVTTAAMLYHILETSMRLVHPFMPFISEEIWQRINNIKNQKSNIKNTNQISKIKNKELGKRSIMVAEWPKAEERLIDKKAEEDMELLIEIIQAIRNLLAELNIKNLEEVSLILIHFPKRLEKYSNYLSRLTRIENISYQSKKPTKAISTVVQKTEIYLVLKDIDLSKGKKRLTKKIEELNKELERVSQKLKNKDFLQKAPREVVQKTKETKEKLKQEREKILVMLRGI